MKKYGISHDGLATYEIIDKMSQRTVEDDKKTFSSNPAFKLGEHFYFSGHTIKSWGDDNQLPYEVNTFIKYNHILPEIIKKQVRIMFGQGPYLYKIEKDEEKRLVKEPIPWKEYPEIKSWLESWQINGNKQTINQYLIKAIYEYYNIEGYFTKWRFNRSRRVAGPMPVRGLECLNSVHCRLAMPGMHDSTERITDNELSHVIIGDWEYPTKKEFEVYNRYEASDPLRYPVSINYTADRGYNEDVYANPTYYYGCKEWIRGTNLNPKYINSYLKNSLNAKLHVLIPESWIESLEDKLRDICDINKERDQSGDDMITEYEGITGIGKTFNYSLVQQIIDNKIKMITEVLSGEGENQGKIFVSRKYKSEHGIEEWEIKDIPSKYKEFVESIINYQQESVKSIIAGKGMHPSISNVSNEGIFSNSGSEAYYNYLIYLDTLPYAEEFITNDINKALWINFPELEAEDIKLGLYHNKPKRQEDTKPKERMENQPNN